MKNISIHRLLPSEWRRYKTIQLEALKQDPQSFGASFKKWKDFSDEKWQERPSNPDSIIFLALNEEEPIGLTGIHFEKENGDRVAHIWGMYVSPDFRSLGIGKSLMEAALEAVKENQVNKATLMVNSEELPAIRLYEKMGFDNRGTTDYLLGDGKEHLLNIMEKDL